MINIIRNSYYQGKNMFRDFGFLFWSLAYPLIMATFFYTAFNGMLSLELKDINIAVETGNPIVSILQNIDILNVEEVSIDEAKEKLNNEEIDGFIGKDLTVTVKKSGINQMIIKEIVEQMKQIKKLNQPIESFDFSKDYIINKNQKADPVIITFYALIAMVSTYGIFAGIVAVSLIQANLSNIGARINVTPLKKHEFLLAGFIVALLLNLFANAILLIFIQYVLKLTLFTEVRYSAIFIILGNLFGVTLGIFVGACNKKSSHIKVLIGIVVTLFLSFLSGMMGPSMKIIIDQHAPIVAKINPISIITNNLYRINLLENTKYVGEGIWILITYCVLLMGISYLYLRRANYDNI